MNVYYDTGVFFDYLIFASHAGLVLRTTARRHRDNAGLYSDARECLTKIASSHRGITSCHTLYEVEGAMFSALKNRAKGIDHAGKMLILSARPVILQTIKVVERFEIEIKDMTHDLIRCAANNVVFSTEGVKLGDTLHMEMAIRENADLIISGDDHMLSFDKKLSNASGKTIRCLDTDEAKGIL